MATDNDDLLSAINASLESDAPAAEPVVEEAAPEVTEEVTPEVVAETTTETTEESAPESTEPAAEGEKPAAEAAKTEAAKPAAEVAKPEVTKDPVNDPIDGRLKPETKQRIESLITTTKTITAERDQARGELNEIIAAVTETNANPEQYAQMLSYLKMVNSPNVADKRQCLAFMQNEMRVLAAQLGEPVAGVDMLSAHPDLQEAVRDGGLSDQHAQEIAAARERGKIQNQASQQYTAQTQAEQHAQQQRQDGGRALNQWEAQAKATDPHFAAKYPAFKAMALEMKPAMLKMDPSLWVSVLSAAYKSLPNPQPAPVPPATRAIPRNEPLRATNPAGGAATVAKSFEDAIGLALNAR